jgi:hypothetical protein
VLQFGSTDSGYGRKQVYINENKSQSRRLAFLLSAKVRQRLSVQNPQKFQKILLANLCV